MAFRKKNGADMASGDDQKAEPDTIEPETVKERILSVAMLLFADLPYDRVTVREVAGRAGISMPTLYHHYGDKQSLYHEVVKTASGEWSEQLFTALETHATSLRDVLYQFFWINLSHIVERTPHARIVDRLITEEVETAPEFKPIGALTARLNTILSKSLNGLVPESDQEDVAYFIMSLAYGSAKMLSIRHNLPDQKGGSEEIQDLAERLTDMGVRFIAGGELPAGLENNAARVYDQGQSAIYAAENQQLKLLLADMMLQLDTLKRRPDSTTAS